MSLRRIRYEPLGAHGPTGETVEGTVADLLLAIPYLLFSKLVPPLPVLNDILGRGLVDMGMSGGCSWEPFQLTAPEYAGLVATLLARPGFRTIEAPDWVRTHADWGTWMLARRGVPSAELRPLVEAEDRARRALDEARASGDDPLILERHLAALRAGQRVSDCIAKYLHPGSRAPGSA